MYQEYLLYKKNPKNIEICKAMCSESMSLEKRKELIEVKMLELFADEQEIDYDGQTIFHDFPLKEKLNILEHFVDDQYAFFRNSVIEILKLIYDMWDDYKDFNWRKHNRSYPHNNFAQCFYACKQMMREMRGMDNERYLKLCKRNHRGYYNWHIMGLFPLLGDEGMQILQDVIKLPYDNAQDYMMFSIYKFSSPEFLPCLRYIFSYWNKHRNIKIYSSGTGMVGQIRRVIAKYRTLEINLYDDPVIGPVLNENGL